MSFFPNLRLSNEAWHERFAILQKDSTRTSDVMDLGAPLRDLLQSADPRKHYQQIRGHYILLRQL